MLNARIVEQFSSNIKCIRSEVLILSAEVLTLSAEVLILSDETPEDWNVKLKVLLVILIFARILYRMLDVSLERFLSDAMQLVFPRMPTHESFSFRNSFIYRN